MDKYFEFLEKLRDSGETNMYGAVPYLMDEFPELDRKKTGDILTAWMHSFEVGGDE